MMRILMVLLVLLMAPAATLASDAADRLAAILEQQRQIQTGIAQGEDYGLTPRELNVVRKAQSEVFKLTEGKSSMDQLNIEEKVRLDNALERINTQVKGGDLDHAARGEEEVCRRERRTGSTTKVTVCATQAEWDRLREGARDNLEKGRICTPPGCGE